MSSRVLVMASLDCEFDKLGNREPQWRAVFIRWVGGHVCGVFSWFLTPLVVYSSTTVIKCYEQKQHGEVRVYFRSQFIFHCTGKLTKELKAESWRQELKKRPLRNISYCLISHSLFSVFSYSTEHYLARDAYSALGALTLIINHQEYAFKDLPTENMMEALPQLSSFSKIIRAVSAGK